MLIPKLPKRSIKYRRTKNFSVALLRLILLLVTSSLLSSGAVINAVQQNNQTVINFASATFHVTERSGFALMEVHRTGDSSVASTVDYQTDDTGSSLNCSEFNGIASSRCDFNTALGTLRFNPGETVKTFFVMINQDAYIEGPFETFGVKLSNPTNASLGALATTQVQLDDINDGSPAARANVIDRTSIFVRQQYRDFLNRDPDLAGLTFWVDNIDKCQEDERRPAGMTVDQCKAVMRINTSAAFFLSIEFSQTGGLVHAVYSAALDRPNRMPNYLEFVRDTQSVARDVVVGQDNWEQTLNANQTAFLKDFAMRPEFIGLYPTADSPATYVNKLYVHALRRDATATELENGKGEFGASLSAADPGARARVLLRLVGALDSTEEAKNAFVHMQYVGYLRRNPNEVPDTNFDGFDFWLLKLNRFDGNFVDAEMVKAFLESHEYRSRFGP